MLTPVEHKTAKDFFKIYGISDDIQEAIRRRDSYHEVMDALFSHLPEDKRPRVPTELIKGVIGKSVNKVFPHGVKFFTENDSLNEKLQDIIDEIDLRAKLFTIGEEGHITGTVALKSIWDDEDEEWIFEIHPREALTLITKENRPEKIIGVRLRYRVESPLGSDEFYWYQEEWTENSFTYWPLQREDEGQIPDFTEDKAIVEPNIYEAIPFTIIQHTYKLGSPYGASEISEQLIQLQNELIISRDDTSLSHQMAAKPTKVRINDSRGDQIEDRPGAVVDIFSENAHAPADMKLLEYKGVPESVFTAEDRLIDAAHRGRQITSPTQEANLKSGGQLSHVMWQALNQDFVDKYEHLRDNYVTKGVEKHLELMLLIGSRLQTLGKTKGYEGINPKDKKTYNVETSFPPAFEMSPQEKREEKTLIESMPYPARLKAEKLANLFGIKDQDIISEMEAIIEQKEQAKAELFKILPDNKQDDDE
jgi:hypothetical protein